AWKRLANDCNAVRQQNRFRHRECSPRKWSGQLGHRPGGESRCSLPSACLLRQAPKNPVRLHVLFIYQLCHYKHARAMEHTIRTTKGGTNESANVRVKRCLSLNSG